MTILCSLLNTAMNSSKASGYNMLVGVTGKLPYNHLLYKGEDPKVNLVSMCLQVLCVVLDFQSGTARDVVSKDGEPVPTARTNAFRYLIAKLVSPCVDSVIASRNSPLRSTVRVISLSSWMELSAF